MIKIRGIPVISLKKYFNELRINHIQHSYIMCFAKMSRFSLYEGAAPVTRYERIDKPILTFPKMTKNSSTSLHTLYNAFKSLLLDDLMTHSLTYTSDLITLHGAVSQLLCDGYDDNDMRLVRVAPRKYVLANVRNYQVAVSDATGESQDWIYGNIVNFNEDRSIPFFRIPRPYTDPNKLPLSAYVSR